MAAVMTGSRCVWGRIKSANEDKIARSTSVAQHCEPFASLSGAVGP